MFYVGIYLNGTGNGFTCHYFNITASTSSSTSSSSSSQLPTSSTTSSPTHSPTSAPNQSISTDAKIGIGVVVPVFVIVVSIAGFVFWKRYQRLKAVLQERNEPVHLDGGYGLYIKPELSANEMHSHEVEQRQHLPTLVELR